MLFSVMEHLAKQFLHDKKNLILIYSGPLNSFSEQKYDLQKLMNYMHFGIFVAKYILTINVTDKKIAFLIP